MDRKCGALWDFPNSVRFRKNQPRRFSNRLTSLAENQVFFRPWMETGVTRTRFLHSRAIARLWPASLRAASLPYFGLRPTMTHLLEATSQGIRAELPRVHDALTHTPPLPTLALWLLGSDANLQRAANAAAAKGVRDPQIDYQQGLAALATGAYADAERLFHATQGCGSPQQDCAALRVYALCMAGRREEATRLVAESKAAPTANEGDERFLRAVLETCALNQPQVLRK